MHIHKYPHLSIALLYQYINISLYIYLALSIYIYMYSISIHIKHVPMTVVSYNRDHTTHVAHSTCTVVDSSQVEQLRNHRNTLVRQGQTMGDRAVQHQFCGWKLFRTEFLLILIWVLIDEIYIEEYVNQRCSYSQITDNLYICIQTPIYLTIFISIYLAIYTDLSLDIYTFGKRTTLSFWTEIPLRTPSSRTRR